MQVGSDTSRARDTSVNGDWAIEAHGLTRVFGKNTAVEQLDLAIPYGTVFGFLGPNGAGKTTTVRMLTALIAPTRGTAHVAGYEIGADNQAIRQQVGMLTESPGLYDHLSALENLVFFARLYNLSADEANHAAESYLRSFDLWERRKETVGGFSKGMRQKLAIARALLHNPPIIFLDEPTSGLDPAAARMVREEVKKLRAEGRTIFLTTHNLTEAEELCDLVGIFRTRLLRLDTLERMRQGHQAQRIRIVLGGAAAPWLPTVQALHLVEQAVAEERCLMVTVASVQQANPLLIRTLVEAGAEIQYVEPMDESLEHAYLRLIGTEGE
ncbi:MAG: ABC transporter ATP-binding protein [Chloroflexaceae bacterium]|nr:ABC transporter ATP-binding protein [Chloroflexaceae bacterium]